MLTSKPASEPELNPISDFDSDADFPGKKTVISGKKNSVETNVENESTASMKKTVQISICPTTDDLEYFVKVQNLQKVSPKVSAIKTHLSLCPKCRIRLQDLDSTTDQLNETVDQDFHQVVAGCQLLQRIGGGAMGDVYKANKISLNRPVAVKVLLSTKGNSAERFQREARTLAKVDHPNITRVYDYHVSEDEKHYYLIMQFVDGEDLEHFIKDKKTLSLEDAIPLWIQMLHGLEALHEGTIIHRDIKPSNLLIDKRQRIKLTDFGLAKPQFDDNLTLNTSIMGTPNYMSPEACRAEEQTFQSDIYSLGGVFFFTLIGSPPFRGSAIHELIYKNLNEDPPSLVEKIPGFPKEIDAIVAKMLAKTYEARYKNCAEIIKDLVQFSKINSIELRIKTGYYSRSVLPNLASELPSPSTSEKDSKKRHTSKIVSAKALFPGQKISDLKTDDSTRRNKKFIPLQKGIANKDSDSSLKKGGTSTVPFPKPVLTPSEKKKLKVARDPSTTSKIIPLFTREDDTSTAKPILDKHKLGQNKNSFKAKTNITTRFKVDPRKRGTAVLPKSGMGEQVCGKCKQLKSVSKFFICYFCGQSLCENHQENQVLCHHCFDKTCESHSFYKKIYHRLLPSSSESLSSGGSVNFKKLSKLINYFSTTNQNNLLIVGNQQRKKGFGFIGDSLLLVDFGEKHVIRLGDLLIQLNKINSEQLHRALEYQKKSSTPAKKLGRILIEMNLLSEETLCEALKKQFQKELLMTSSLEQSIYKCQFGEVPDSLMSGMMQNDCQIKLSNAVEFKQSLASLFLHLDFMIRPGLFKIHSNRGRIGLLLENGKLEFVQFQPRNFASFENIAIGSKSFKETFGNEILTYLADPQYQCQFIEKKTEDDFKKLSRFAINVDLNELLYELLGKIDATKKLMTAGESLSLLLNKKSVLEMKLTLQKRLHEELNINEIQGQFEVFEASFLLFLFLKSNYLNALAGLKKQAHYLSKSNFQQAANYILECAKELL